MRFRPLLLALALSTGVSATAEAPVEEDDFMSGLVNAVNGGVREVPDSLLDYIPSEKGIFNVLDRLLEQTDDAEWPEEEYPAIADIAGDPVGGALSALCSLSTLDYLTNAYEGNDFYASGYWGKDGKTYSSSVYTGSLPEFSEEDFIRPALGRITSLYGYRERFHRVHKGVDIALRTGDPVGAALPGVVGRIGYEPGGYGHFIVVAHRNGVETRYAHLSEVCVYPGQKVAPGDLIGRGGSTGNSTGPHLHFEIRYKGKAVDPLHVFQF